MYSNDWTYEDQAMWEYLTAMDRAHRTERFAVWGTRGGSTRTLIADGLDRHQAIQMAEKQSTAFPTVWAHSPYAGVISEWRWGKPI